MTFPEIPIPLGRWGPRLYDPTRKTLRVPGPRLPSREEWSPPFPSRLDWGGGDLVKTFVCGTDTRDGPI